MGAAGHIVVIGAGAWGSALAQAACHAGNKVTLVARASDMVKEINTQHTNERYLGAQKLDARIIATDDLGVISVADLVILAVPAQHTRGVLQNLTPMLKRVVPLVLTAKGFETRRLALQSEILAEEWQQAVPVVLSGPSFALDVVCHRPTAVTFACNTPEILDRAVALLSSNALRPYLSQDPFGVQLCGGLKNVYALASGAIEGANLGLSARSAFVARALNEMEKIVGALGGDPASVMGLSGIGDLMLSCTSAQSRNYQFGLELGRGSNVKEILGKGLGLAEGVATAPVAMALSTGAQIDAPLVGSVNALLRGDKDIAQIVHGLMSRDLKREGT